MKKLFLYIFLGLLWSNVALAYPFIFTTWKITKFVGESIFMEPEFIIGKTQMFYKGDAEGVFYNCSAEGQYSTYTTYKNWNEFLQNKEFSTFKELKDQLEFKDNSKVYVNRISCAGTGDLFYPFVVFDDWNKAYYLFEGGIYFLERNK